ncbi:MAG TPA: efflux RND transporter periplasmic adaptor subunit [Chthoniobacterales bacterium]|nr:efflux RND transporter periplasmic adaptor subunit [Chthoniobacterales bacterium]
MKAVSEKMRIVGIALGVCLAIGLAACGKKAPPAPPPPEVLVTEVKQQDAPIYNEYVGQLDASVNATIEARVQGYLISQNYKEGQPVKKDDVLFEIDRRPFEAALAQAKAALLQAEASAKQAELNAERSKDLFQRKVASEQERDNAVQSGAAARAQAEAQKAVVEQAQLNLDYTTIKAPVDGIAGLVKVQVGDLINVGTVLTTVTKVDPIKAYFTVSEQRYADYAKRWADPQERAQHEKELRFELLFPDGSTYEHPGELFAIENQVDVRTGSLRIAAQFPNPGNILRPGQFARIRVQSEIRKDAILVPQRAVTELQGNYQIAIVGPDNKVHIQPVKMGRRVDHDWIVEEGLKPGDRIVVEGVQKVREGAVVNPKPWTPPKPSPSQPPSRQL